MTYQNKTDNKTDDKENDQSYVKIFKYIYVVIGIITFFLYIICGVKSGSVGQVFVGLFLSMLWPLLLVYVLVKKTSNHNYRFCAKNLSSSLRKSVTKSVR